MYRELFWFGLFPDLFGDLVKDAAQLASSAHFKHIRRNTTAERL